MKKGFKDFTVLEWMGIIILFNTTLLGSASQLADLMLPAVAIKAIMAVATIGNAFLGGLVLKFGGMQAQKDTVGASGALVVTSGASADALPNNPNVVAATPELVRAIRASQ